MDRTVRQYVTLARPTPTAARYPRNSLLGFTEREVSQNSDGTFTVTWTFTPHAA